MIPILEITAIAVALVVSANLVSAWLINLTNTTKSSAKRAVSALAAAVTTLAVKFLGYPAVVAVIAIFSGETEFPAEPNVPADFGAVNWILVGAFTWALSGGVVDLSKQLKKVKND